MDNNFDEMTSRQLNNARAELAYILKYIKDIIMNDNIIIDNNDDNIFIDNKDKDLVINYMKSFNIKKQTNLTKKDKIIINLLDKRIKSGVLIIEAKIELDNTLVDLNYDEFMKKITYKDVEDKIVNDIRSWCVPLSTLFETYIIPETKNVQYNYAKNLCSK